MDFKQFFSRQAGHPSGLFGRWVMATIFDRGNMEINGMMKDLLEVQENDRILEIGFGTGKLMGKLAGLIGQGVIEGVDVSETMFLLAQKRNEKEIAAGRVKIRQGNFDELDFGDRTFDKICSANTLFFWPDPVFTIKKAHQLLKPGGKLVLGFEDQTRLENKPIDREVFHIYSQTDVKGLMEAGGFGSKVEVRSLAGARAGLCCAVAHKDPLVSVRK